jgi:uncharacterized protein (TIGR02246 family)
MTVPDRTQDEVRDAASRLVAAFAAHDTSAYFASFTPDATFVFYTHGVPLRSREDYRDLWTSWEQDGFRVLSCTSSEQQVQPLSDDTAVFNHRVHTVVRTGDEQVALDERETIVFQRQSDGAWLAVHEHLSPTTAGAA